MPLTPIQRSKSIRVAHNEAVSWNLSLNSIILCNVANASSCFPKLKTSPWWDGEKYIKSTKCSLMHTEISLTGLGYSTLLPKQGSQYLQNDKKNIVHLPSPLQLHPIINIICHDSKEYQFSAPFKRHMWPLSKIYVSALQSRNSKYYTHLYSIPESSVCIVFCFWMLHCSQVMHICFYPFFKRKGIPSNPNDWWLFTHLKNVVTTSRSLQVLHT